MGTLNATASAHCHMAQTVERHAFAFSTVHGAVVFAISTGSEEEGWRPGNAAAGSQVQYHASWTQLKTRRARISIHMYNEASGTATLGLRDNSSGDQLDLLVHVGANTGFRVSARLETNVTLLASHSYAVNVSAGEAIDTGALDYPIIGRSIGVAGYVSVEVLMMPTLTLIRRPGRASIGGVAGASGDLLTWEASGEPFTLQSAASLGGPWIDVTNYAAEGGNYTLPIDTTAPAQFFRYREESGLTNFVPPSSTNWFSNETLDPP